MIGKPPRPTPTCTYLEQITSPVADAQTSYFDRRIYEEWDALCYSTSPSMPLDEREARVKALLDSCLDSGQWTVSIQNASMASYHPVVLALQGKRYAEAIAHCIFYLHHPEIDEADDIDRSEFLAYLGIAHILNGDFDLGIAVLKEFLGNNRGPAQYRRHLTRNRLVDALSDLNASNAPDERISTFVSHLFKGWKGQGRKANMALVAKTNDELRELLVSTYSKRTPRPNLEDRATA
jgi:hypothetical protein